MIRPAYLDNPHAIHSRRTTTDAARDACAIERHAQPWTLHTLAIAAIGVVSVALAFAGWI
jgi:hypothetical protein